MRYTNNVIIIIIKASTNYPFHLLCKTSPVKELARQFNSKTVIESKIGIIVRETSNEVVGPVLDEIGFDGHSTCPLAFI